MALFDSNNSGIKPVRQFQRQVRWHDEPKMHQSKKEHFYCAKLQEQKNINNITDPLCVLEKNSSQKEK